MAESIGPSYQLVADDLREKIRAGELRVGDPIPSTVRLIEQYDVSSTVVRHAVAQLRADGILIGHPGKGVYVKTMPADADREHASVAELAAMVEELRNEVRALSHRDDIADLRTTVGRLETYLIDLYGKGGYEYPRDTASGRGSRKRTRQAADTHEQLA